MLLYGFVIYLFDAYVHVATYMLSGEDYDSAVRHHWRGVSVMRGIFGACSIIIEKGGGWPRPRAPL